jgi:hypothetical protein
MAGANTNRYTYHSSEMTTSVESYTKQEKRGVIQFLAAEGDKLVNSYHKMKVISKRMMVFLDKIMTGHGCTTLSLIPNELTKQCHPFSKMSPKKFHQLEG